VARRRNGEGTVFQRKDGRWQASIMVSGTRRCVYGKTEREASQRLSALKKEVTIAGGLPNPGKLTVNDLLDRWLETIAPTLKPRTLSDYQHTCNKHIRPTLGKVRLARLDPNQIQSLYNKLHRAGKMRTAQVVHARLNHAFKLAVLWRLLPENPCSRVLRPQYRAATKEVWTPAELAVFLDGAREHWLHPLWVTAIATGCRIGELLALTWEDIDWNADSLSISKTIQRIDGEYVVSSPKTQRSERTISLPQEAIAALKRQRAQQAARQLKAGDKWENFGLVFTGRKGRPLCKTVAGQGLGRECERLSITRVNLHGLRHLHASLLLEQGLSVPQVSRRLGHANPAITLSIYAHVVRRDDRAAAEAIGRAMTGT